MQRRSHLRVRGMSTMDHRLKYLTSVLIVLVASNWVLGQNTSSTSASRNYLRNPSVSRAQAESLSQAFQDAADSILPAVVKIRTTTSSDREVLIQALLDTYAKLQDQSLLRKRRLPQSNSF